MPRSARRRAARWTRPSRRFASASTERRASAGVCDVAENCSGGDPACPTDVTQPDGTACLDGDVCNGDEVCEVGVCVSGTPLDCDDDDDCTADSCEEISGCENDPIPGCGPPIPTTGNWGSLMLTLLWSCLSFVDTFKLWREGVYDAEESSSLPAGAAA